MTINRQWIAREWLYLLAGFVWAYVLSPILVKLLALVFPVVPRLGDLIAFGPYVLYQVVRITMWAIRTVREPS